MKPKRPKELPLYLTPEEVAELLRVDRRTVYNWLRSGELPALHIGRMWRIHRDQVIKPTDSPK